MSNKTSNGKRGGNLEGKPHYNKKGDSVGGIKAVVSDNNNQPVELEGGEVIINKEASKKHWKALSKINQSAGNGVAIGPPVDPHIADPDEYKKGGKIDFNPNKIPNKWILKYAEDIKKNHPEIWKMGGNMFGNQAFVNLKRVAERGYWLDSEEWMMIKWRSFVARHKSNFRIAGVIAMLKWVDKVDKGWPYMKKLIEAEIKKRENKGVKTTNALKDDDNWFKKGGSVNSWKNKFNTKYGFEKKKSHSLKEIAKLSGVSMSGIQGIYNKGIGAFKTNPGSVRPNVTSKEQWAYARVYSAVMGGKAATVDAKELKMEVGGYTDKSEITKVIITDFDKKNYFGQYKKVFDAFNKGSLGLSDGAYELDSSGKIDSDGNYILLVSEVLSGDVEERLSKIKGISFEEFYVDKKLKMNKGGNTENIKQYSESELQARSLKKKNSLKNIASKISRLKAKLNSDLKSDDVKNALLSLVILTMLETSERVGNETSASNGHVGVTGLKKSQVKILGSNIRFAYVGKSGVKHNKEIKNEKLANGLRKAIKNSQSESVFETSDGFKVKNDTVNRYLNEFDVTAKDLRGYSANKQIAAKLKRISKPGEKESERKNQFRDIVKAVAENVGHGAATLKKHYLLPELESNWMTKGKVIDLANFKLESGGKAETYKKGGKLKNTMSKHIDELEDISKALTKGSKIHKKQSEQLEGASNLHLNQSKQLDRIAGDLEEYAKGGMVQTAFEIPGTTITDRKQQARKYFLDRKTKFPLKKTSVEKIYGQRFKDKEFTQQYLVKALLKDDDATEDYAVKFVIESLFESMKDRYSPRIANVKLVFLAQHPELSPQKFIASVESMNYEKAESSSNESAFVVIFMVKYADNNEGNIECYCEVEEFAGFLMGKEALSGLSHSESPLKEYSVKNITGAVMIDKQVSAPAISSGSLPKSTSEPTTPKPKSQPISPVKKSKFDKNQDYYTLFKTSLPKDYNEESNLTIDKEIVELYSQFYEIPKTTKPASKPKAKKSPVKTKKPATSKKIDKEKLLDEIERSFKVDFPRSLKADRPDIDRYENDITFSTRYLGEWNLPEGMDDDDPDAEDNDNEELNRDDYENFLNKFDNWVNTKSWAQYVRQSVNTGEKNYIYFSVILDENKISK